MDNKIINEYKEYINKIGDRKGLYALVANAYSIKSALYPGSHIDITPSLVIPKVTYVDNFKGTIKFFQSLSDIKAYVQSHKDYDEPFDLKFLGLDYTSDLDIDKVDLLISQYAGFVGQATKSS